MKNHTKRILGVFAAATMLASSIALAGCNNTSYKGDQLDGYVSDAAVYSNGGFAVEKGDFVYFINGVEDYTADNTYGNVLKGSLMRISKADLAAKNYSNVKKVVPSLLVEEDHASGIYIYGDYVYYATPVTDKDKTGTILNDMLDLKRAKLDGTAAPEDKPLVRLSTNSVTYRFVEEGGNVYCVYEETDDDGIKRLKSYDVNAKTTTILVASAKSEFFFDTKDLTNPNVYYTMAVTNDLDTDNTSKASYDQLFCVNAATKAVVNASEASYKATLGDTIVAEYDFDETFFAAKNKEAKDNKEDEPYDLSDLSGFPYVNLGRLVLDGVGINSKLDVDSTDNKDNYHKESKETAATPDGYTYGISSYQNGGVYFTRTDVNSTDSTSENEKLYYLSDTKSEAAAWNTITGQKEGLTIIANNTTNASTSALFVYDAENDTHRYFYLNDSGELYRAEQLVNGTAKTVRMANNLSGAALLKVDETTGYLYYYMSGTNGYNLSRIKYDGQEDRYDYNVLLNNKEYQPVTVSYMDWSKDWYKPEFFTVTNAAGESVEVVLYANAQKIIGTAYEYIYALELGTNDDIRANNEAYDAVDEYIDEKVNSDDDIRDAMDYYFHTGKTTAFEAVRSLYSDYEDQAKVFDDFVAKFTSGELKKESDFFAMVGGENAMTTEHKEAIDTAWANSLRTEDDTDDDEGWPTWAIVLVIVGGVLVVAAGVTIPLVIASRKKKAKKAQEEQTVNAYKRKIDTTDDKTIDVYADNASTEESTETAEVAEPETTEESIAEESIEETVETSEPAAEEVATEETIAPTENAEEATSAEETTEE